MVGRFPKLLRTFSPRPLPHNCPFLEEAMSAPHLRELHVGCLKPCSLSALRSARAPTVQLSTTSQSTAYPSKGSRKKPVLNGQVCWSPCSLVIRTKK